MAKHNHYRNIDVNAASPARLGLFQPTRRPVFKTWRVETPWGSANITGRLGARHLDFIECARLVAEAQGVDGVGRFCCIVDPSKLRTAMSPKRALIEWKQLKNLAVDLRMCEISDLHIASNPRFGVITAGVLDSVIFEGVEQVPARKGARVGGVVKKGKEVVFPGRAVEDGETRELWMVSFSKPFSELIGNDLPTSYRGRLREIVALRHGVSQAVARFMLSHEPGAAYSLDLILRTVGVEPAVMHHRRKDIQDDADGLAAAGVYLTPNGMVSTAKPNLNPGQANLNPGQANLNPGQANLNPGSYRHYRPIGL